VHNLLEKLHVGSRVQAAARATLPAGRRRRSDLVASPLPKAD
jgi:hypothetical protein